MANIIEIKLPRAIAAALRIPPNDARHQQISRNIARSYAQMPGGGQKDMGVILTYALANSDGLFGGGIGRRVAVFIRQILTHQTLMLILGDARNNRRPPRPDLLARIRSSAKKLVWLNPEAPTRWNTGDSVMKLYEPACDMLLACGNLQELLAALKHAL